MRRPLSPVLMLPLLGVLALPQEAASATPIGQWKFDEGSGTTAGDSSGLGHDGTLVGGPLWTTGKLGQGLSFDGVDDRVDVAHAADLDAYPLSVAAWFKTSSTSGVRGIVGKYVAGSYNGYNLFLNDGSLCAWYLRDDSNYVYDGSGCPFRLTGYNDGQWHHAVYVVDASGARLYVDGAEKGSLGWTGVAGAVSTTEPARPPSPPVMTPRPSALPPSPPRPPTMRPPSSTSSSPVSMVTLLPVPPGLPVASRP